MHLSGNHYIFHTLFGMASSTFASSGIIRHILISTVCALYIKHLWGFSGLPLPGHCVFGLVYSMYSKLIFHLRKYYMVYATAF